MANKKQVSAAESWERSLTAVSLLLRKFDLSMQAEAEISIIWYDVLLHLNLAEGKKMRMQALAESLILTRSGVTRLVDRIEKAGLVRREAAAEDRRGYYAILTDEGLTALNRAQKRHRKDIKEFYGSHLSEKERQSLYVLMSKVLDGNG